MSDTKHWKGISEIVRPKLGVMVSLLSRNLPPDTTRDKLEAIIDQEVFNMEYQFYLRPEFKDCSEISIENAFRKTIMQNLSFDKDYDLVWFAKREFTIEGRKELQLECKWTANGDISIHKQTGSLLDVDTSHIEFDPVSGLVKKVRIVLICPTYNTDGNVNGQSEKTFEFGLADFRIWQKAAHKQNSNSSKPGIMADLSNSSESYWSYYPNQTSSDDLATSAKSMGDKPKCGITPGFALTKCVRHAFRRAKLERNPYAKRFVYVNHKKYVESVLDDEIEVTYIAPAAPEFPDSEPVQTHQKAVEEKFEQILKKEESVMIQTPNVDGAKLTDQDVLNLAMKQATKEDCLKVYKQYLPQLDKNQVIKNQIIAHGKKLAENPAPIQTQAEPIKKEITSDDL